MGSGRMSRVDKIIKERVRRKLKGWAEDWGGEKEERSGI
jgi:hypothetical protein